MVCITVVILMTTYKVGPYERYKYGYTVTPKNDLINK